jgi:uncharacterized protein YbbK (DUF523 family)
MDMSYQDHYRTCPYCNKGLASPKPTIRIKSASSCEKRRKLVELGHLIKGTPTKTKGASSQPERQFKLKELGRLIRGL